MAFGLAQLNKTVIVSGQNITQILAAGEKRQQRGQEFLVGNEPRAKFTGVRCRRNESFQIVQRQIRIADHRKMILELLRDVGDAIVVES